MKAAVLDEPNEPLAIEDVVVDAPGPREVLVRTVASGVCASDLHLIRRRRGPIVPGHEPAGIVEQIGADVTHVKPGDRVIACLSIFCGVCDFCISGRSHLCGGRMFERRPGEPPRLSRHGAPVGQMSQLSSFAEQMLVPENALVKVRDEMPLDRAALIGCSVMTGVGAVMHTSKVRPGETVAVIGCGGVGLACINGAAIAGAGRIIAVDMQGSKLNLAKEFGATDVVNPKDGDPVKQVIDMTNGGVHHSFEAIGLKQTAEQSFRMLARGGTANIIGMIPVGQSINLMGAAFLGEKRIQGSLMGSNRFPVDMPRLVDAYMAGKLHLDDMISRRIRLDQVNEAFEEMKTGAVARSVIVFDA